MSRDEELEETSEQSRISLSKNLIRPLLCRIAEDDGSRDVLSRSQMDINKRDEVTFHFLYGVS
jgi:hypothetical protein